MQCKQYFRKISLFRLSRLAIEQKESTFLGLFMDTVFSLIACLMAFGSAIMITLGFIKWCSRMTLRFPSYVSLFAIFLYLRPLRLSNLFLDYFHLPVTLTFPQFF